MIIRNVDGMITDIKQNIERVEKAIDRLKLNPYNLSPVAWHGERMRLSTEKSAYEHCLEMAEALRDSQELAKRI